MPFQCSICEEPSTRICVRCTKDACDNHICEKCLKCSDCCECEVALNSSPRIAPTVHTPPEPEGEAEDTEVQDVEAETAPSFSEAPAPGPVPLDDSQPPAQEDIEMPMPGAE